MKHNAGMNRKELIKAAAIELFAKQGYQATPTAEVAKLAGVSEGTIFYHFVTKEGILLSLFEEIMDELLAGIRKVLEESPNGLEGLLNCLRLQSDLAEQRSQESLILLRDMPASFSDPESPHYGRIMVPIKKLIRAFQQAIETGLRDGSIGKCDPEVGAYLILSIMKGASRMRLLDQPPPPDLSQAMLDFCRKGFAADKSNQE